MTEPVLPHLEEDDHVMVDGVLAYERMYIDDEVVSRPIVLANFIVPFVNTQRTCEPYALVRGN